MATKKKSPKPRHNAAKSSLQPAMDTFEILTDPPPPVRAQTLETVAFLEKLERTMQHVQVGHAFIIPRKKEPAAKRWLKAAFPNELFSFMKVVGNTDFLRVYRLPLPKKKPK